MDKATYRTRAFSDSSSHLSEEALSILHQTRETGANTLRELERQGTQLKNMESKLNKIEENVTTSERILRKMGSIFGGIENAFSSGPKFIQLSSSAPSSNQTQNNSNIPSSNHSSFSPHFFSNAKHENCTSASSPVSQKNKDEVDRDLDEMSKILKELKEMGIAMDKELASQSNSISIIEESVDRNSSRIKKANVKALQQL